MDRRDLGFIYKGILLCDVNLSVKKRMQLIRAMERYYLEERNAALLCEHMETARDYAESVANYLRLQPNRQDEKKRETEDESCLQAVTKNHEVRETVQKPFTHFQQRQTSPDSNRELSKTEQIALAYLLSVD